MNEPLPDRVVIAVITVTVILIFAMVFAIKPKSDDERPFLWRDSSLTPPAQVRLPLEKRTLAI